MSQDDATPIAQVDQFLYFSIGTINGNTWSSTQEVLRWWQKQFSLPHVILVQEARFVHDRLVQSAYQWCRGGSPV